MEAAQAGDRGNIDVIYLSAEDSSRQALGWALRDENVYQSQ